LEDEMTKALIVSALALALAAPAAAGSFDYGCMRNGPMSEDCALAQMQRQQENERQREQLENARRAQECAVYRRCY
jgi:uncharacterized protein HemX